MRLTTSGLLALGLAAGIDAFRNTSPFFFFSTHDFETTPKQIESAEAITHDIYNKLLSCPSDFYIIVSQPGVHVLDYSSRKAAPRLREKVLKLDNDVKSSFMVSEVVGSIDTTELVSRLEASCGADSIALNAGSNSFPPLTRRDRPQIITLDFPELPVDPKRAETLVDYDLFLATVIDHLPAPKYTVVYATTARTYSGADSDYLTTQDPLHLQSKRESTFSNNTEFTSQPLFEKYQFLSPGIFMGLMVVLFFLVLLYIAISGIASVKVSYAAFDKMNGPAAAAAAKKQQ